MHSSHIPVNKKQTTVGSTCIVAPLVPHVCIFTKLSGQIGTQIRFETDAHVM